MKFVLISDTHTQHDDRRLVLPKGDAIIHAGDISYRGGRIEVENFLKWYDALPYKYKILIAGNHDFFFETYSKETVDQLLSQYPTVIYLNDSGITIEDIKIWGSPVQPWFHSWAFNRRGEEICKHWDLIPLDTNILITHGPVHGYLDLTLNGDVTGCPYLLKKIPDLKELKLHVCGHIHEAYGEVEFADGVKFVNASVLDARYVMKNKPVVVEIKK